MRRLCRLSGILILFVGLSIALPRPAFAVKNRTIILRATGSGAALGALAGLVSYPFAKSQGTIVAGALVGAVLGTVYGFHLVEERKRAFGELAGTESSSFRARDPALENREWQARQSLLAKSTGPQVIIPVSFSF